MNANNLNHRFRRYLDIEEGLSVNTLKDMSSRIRTFIKRSNIEDISDISLGTIKEFFYVQRGVGADKWSYYTYCNYHKYLKKFFNWCIKEGYMKENYINAIKKPKRPQRLPRRLSEADIQKLLYEAYIHDWRYAFEQVRNHTIIATYLYSGIRRGELLNLELTDINLNDDSILIRCGKGDKDRIIPVHFKLKRILVRYMQERVKAKKKSMHLFVGARSSIPLTISAIRGIFKKLQKGSGVKVTPHMLRHTFASIAVEQGVPLSTVQQILGHSSLQSTMIYLRMSSKALKIGLNAVDLF